jgi:serine/threonine protein kinase
VRTERRVDRFRREGDILERLDHPNVVRLLDRSQASATSGHWIALEYVDGPSVESLIEREGGPLQTNVVLALAAEVCRALVHLAQKGVVHRDVKPANLVVTAGGTVKLVDFGIACTVDEDGQISDEGPIIPQDLPIGTVDYMAPEQVENADELTARVDVFALGSTAYRCLAGMTPFTGETVFARLRELVERDPPPLPRAVPKEVSALIFALLEKDPKKRMDAAAVLVAVETLAGSKNDKEWSRKTLADLLAQGPRAKPAPSDTGPITTVLASAELTIERALHVGQGYLIGRSLADGQASTSIGKPWISRHHCRIELGERGLIVTDLGSANGTFVNKLRVKPSNSALLRPGDTLQLGKTILKVSLENAPPGFARPAWKCLLCGIDLPPDAASTDEATGVEERHLCARCRSHIEQDRSAGEERARVAIESLGAQPMRRFELGGHILRFEVVTRDGKRWAAHAIDIGPSAAPRYVELSKKALDLDHPGILRARAVREAKGVLIVLTDPVAGRPADGVVLRDGPLPAEEVKHVAMVLAQAFAHARSRGVLALAIRPSHVLIGDGRVVKALDVGLAPGLVEAGRSRVELGRAVPCYDAPEAAGVREPFPTATVFSVAAVAHFLLTGEAPVEVRSQNRRVKADPLSGREGIPAELAKVLDRALDDDPKKRPQTPESFADELHMIGRIALPPPPKPVERTQTFKAFDIQQFALGFDEESDEKKPKKS